MRRLSLQLSTFCGVSKLLRHAADTNTSGIPSNQRPPQPEAAVVKCVGNTHEKTDPSQRTRGCRLLFPSQVPAAKALAAGLVDHIVDTSAPDLVAAAVSFARGRLSEVAGGLGALRTGSRLLKVSPFMKLAEVCCCVVHGCGAGLQPAVC